MHNYWWFGFEPILTWATRIILVLSLVSCLAYAVAGCTMSLPDPLSGGSRVKAPLALREDNMDRNQQPQGGTDEKSDCAPKKPTGWFQ